MFAQFYSEYKNIKIKLIYTHDRNSIAIQYCWREFYIVTPKSIWNFP